MACLLAICVGNVLYLKKLKDTERNISLIIGYFQGIMLYLAQEQRFTIFVFPCLGCFEGYDIMCTLSITIPDELEVFLRKRGRVL